MDSKIVHKSDYYWQRSLVINKQHGNNHGNVVIILILFTYIKKVHNETISQ